MRASDAVLKKTRADDRDQPQMPLIRRIRLRNLLSYGPDSDWIDLQSLNVLIGPNGSGKSNLISALEVVHWAPKELRAILTRNGRIEDWAWKGEGSNGLSSIEAVVSSARWSDGLKYSLSFRNHPLYFQIEKEFIEAAPAPPGGDVPYYVYYNEAGEAYFRIGSDAGSPSDPQPTSTSQMHVDGSRSAVSLFRGPSYPELTYLAEKFEGIGFFRAAGFGPNNPLKRAQPTDLPRAFVFEDGSNLSLVINRLRVDHGIGVLLDEKMKTFAEDIEGIEVSVEGGSMQIVARMKGMQSVVPMSRLSDGTLRYLCLLSILCDPTPPPLVCIEEPELGLHPDILPRLVDLLIDASSRTQVIVTTHSDIIVDALSDHPDAVLTCEKQAGSTVLRRLEKNELKPWLERFRLGDLWLSGELGAKRW